MPKTKLIQSALHDWVHRLTFQQQALLMTGMRGPDGCEKHCAAKVIVRFLRGAICKPAGNWDGGNNNDFMWGDYSIFKTWQRQFFDDPDGYPHHFIMHLIHCAEVIGYKHPDDSIAHFWRSFYEKACHSFHMYGETEEEMDRRLNDFGVEIAESSPVTSTQEEKEECTCLYGPSDANPHCKYPNCFKPEQAAATKVDREKERPQPNFKWFLGESLPDDIAQEALKEKYPDGKEYEPNHYLPKNHTVILRAAADWGIQWGWKHPLPWEVKNATADRISALQTQLSQAQSNLTSMISEALEKSKRLDEARKEAVDYRRELQAIKAAFEMQGQNRQPMMIQDLLDKYPQPSTPPQTDKQ